MEVATLKVGHFEVNYGDQHFRRSDNGQALYNPFIGNFVIDAFTTEIGAEAYLRKNGYMGMLGMTGGEVHGQVTAPGQRGPSYLAKLGVDRQLGSDIRVRLTGSMYKTDRSASNTLTSGDRAGSRYYDVLENVDLDRDRERLVRRHPVRHEEHGHRLRGEPLREGRRRGVLRERRDHDGRRGDRGPASHPPPARR